MLLFFVLFIWTVPAIIVAAETTLQKIGFGKNPIFNAIYLFPVVINTFNEICHVILGIL